MNWLELHAVSHLPMDAVMPRIADALARADLRVLDVIRHSDISSVLQLEAIGPALAQVGEALATIEVRLTDRSQEAVVALGETMPDFVSLEVTFTAGHGDVRRIVPSVG